MKFTRNIVSIALSLIILFSSVGLTIFVHNCKSQNRIDYSIIYYNSTDDEIDCPNCSVPEKMENCNMEESDSMDNCSTDQSTPGNGQVLELSECCSEFTDFLKLDFQSISLPEINNFLQSTVLFALNYNILLFDDAPVKFLGYLNHNIENWSPYKSNFIHFISSLRE